MSLGLQVSKPGIDVRDASRSQKSFNSKFDYLKIWRTGRLTLTMGGETLAYGATSEYSTSIPHNLGFTPMILPPLFNYYILKDAADYELHGMGNRHLPVAYVAGTATSIGGFVNFSADTADITLSCSRFNLGLPPANATFGIQTVTVYYTIFANKLYEVSYI